MDEENRDIDPVDIPENEEPLVPPKTPREPTNNDFMAGALLANGIIWLWMQSLNLFNWYTSRISPAILVDFTYVTFIVAGFISSQQVAKRSERNQLIVALRSALYSWAGSLFMMLTMPGGLSIKFALIILVCLLAGAVLGSYMLIKSRISARRALIKASS